MFMGDSFPPVRSGRGGPAILSEAVSHCNPPVSKAGPEARQEPPKAGLAWGFEPRAGRRGPDQPPVMMRKRFFTGS